MVKVIGIDPGVGYWDIVAMKDGEIIGEASIETKKFVMDPSLLLAELKTLVEGVDMVVAPSGLGLPIKRVDRLNDEDIAELSLKRPGEPVILGLGHILKLIKELKLPAFVVPGVKHLTTIPLHRKVNKIDMGTADKICAVATAIRDQAERFAIPYNETSFVLTEMGRGFNAVLTVADGQVVDGIGGTLGSIGMKACGALDAELAYLIGEIDKKIIYSGGVLHIAGSPSATGEEIVEMALKGNKLAKIALDTMIEGIVREVAGTLAAIDRTVREMLLSGSTARIERIFDWLAQRLRKFADVRLVRKRAKTASEAAEGAAIIADGLVGGPYKTLVDTLKIKEARGSIYDYIYIKRL